MTNKIKLLIADDIATREQVVNFLATDHEIMVSGQASSAEDAIQLAKKLQPEIVLVGSQLSDMDGFDATKILTTEAPYSNVIIMSPQGKTEDVRRAMIAGAKDYLVKPFVVDELIQSIKRTYANSDRRVVNGIEQKSGKVITLFSTKGGVGKTVLATNLALALASTYKLKVAILDFDLQFGDVSVCLDVLPKASVADVVTDIDHLDEDVLSRYMVAYNEYLDILPAPFQPEMAEKITAQHLIAIINLLKKMYQYIIIDTAPAFDDKTLTAMDFSDFVFVVSLPDLTTTKNVKLSLKTLDTLGYSQENIKLVMNRFNSMGALDIKEIEESLQHQFTITLPNDSEVVLSSVNKGMPFVISNPNSQIARALFTLAKNIFTGEILSQGKKVARVVNNSDAGVFGKIKKLFS